MFFANPYWLLALLPWTGATLWLLWGRRRKNFVPFLDLWKGPALQKPTQRGIQVPPIFLALSLIATLLGTLAAAKPAWRDSARRRQSIAVIVDRGMRMSATSPDGYRFAAAAGKLARDATFKADPSRPIHLITVPPGNAAVELRADNFLAAIEAMPPTAIDAKAELTYWIHQALADSVGPVIVISDQQLSVSDSRLVQISPDSAIENVGIERLAARDGAKPQVMVRLRNQSSRKQVQLRVQSGTNMTERQLDLAPHGQSVDAFVDLPRLDSIIEASVDGGDLLAADHQAWLVREQSRRRIEARTALPAEVQRMIDVHKKARPASPDADAMAIVAAESDFAGALPGVILPGDLGASAGGTCSAVGGPVTANVNWNTFPKTVMLRGKMPTGWTPVVRLGQEPIVAIQDGQARRVWIGFDESGWARETDFVIFWANVLDWAAGGEDRFAAKILPVPDASWTLIDPPPHAAAGQWPGLYRSAEGVVHAYNPPPPDVSATAQSTQGWPARLVALDALEGAGETNLAPGICIAAVGCLTAAALAWKPRRTDDRTGS